MNKTVDWPTHGFVDASTVAPPKTKVRLWSRDWMYFSLTFGVWTFAPLGRRLVDSVTGGFHAVSVVSLFPFLIMLPLVWMCLRADAVARLPKLLRTLAIIWTVAFTYGFLIAVGKGSGGAAVFSFAQYMLPMFAGLWIATQQQPLLQTYNRLAIIVAICAGLASVYGVWQWVNPPAWDVMWVEGASFGSAGAPIPFAMRIFSTLNSPGPAADYFAFAILFLLPIVKLRRIWLWIPLMALSAALLLTLVREAWIGLVVGVLVFLLASPRRFTLMPSLALFGFLVLALVSTLPAVLGSGQNSDFISSRLSTLTDVSHDGSALDRQAEIGDAISSGLNNPLGDGLGNIGAASKLSSNPASDFGNVLDSGYLARLVELGWLGTAGYLAVVLGGPLMLVYRMLQPPTITRTALDKPTGVIVAVALAICCMLAWGDSAGDDHVGLDGLLFWMALGLGSLVFPRANSSEAAIAGESEGNSRTWVGQH